MKTTVSHLFLLVGGLSHLTYALSPNHSEHHLLRRDDDPTHYGWVKRWAAVGDSYTAGIGSGNPLGKSFLSFGGDRNYACSRYDTAYPVIVNSALGSSVEHFEFAACSGDRTGNIYEQIKDLDGDLDLVIMTAGGNDLCLSAMIEKCVFLPYSGEDACQDVIDIAQDNLDTIMKDSFEQLLEALDDKMNKDSVVVWNGYAQFFNTETDGCTKEDWTLFDTGGTTPLHLTVERRKTFNDLVVQINDIIRDVVDATRKADKYKYKIGFSNWDYWPSKGVRGQYCDPDSTGAYPDEEVPDLQFFKPDTTPYVDDDDDGEDDDERDLNKRYVPGEDDEDDIEEASALDAAIFASPLFRRSRNPHHLAHQRLSKRAPSPANCPGDSDDENQESGGGWTPDSVGKNFHPNELGHYTIASWSLQTMMDLRAEILGVDEPTCEPVDEFSCYSDEDKKAYASEGRLNERYKDFCDDVQDNYPEGEKGWAWSRTYDEGTPDETQFKMELDESTASFSYDECRSSMEHIVNGCDGDDPDNNPMDWKFGGRWQRGDRTYLVTPQRDNRPWPPIQEAYGDCEGWYHGIYSSFTIWGAGWSSYDWGQKTLLPSAKDCVTDGGITGWKFKYYDEPTEDGHEWRADFNTPIWYNARCFDNDKVQKGAGGWTDGCKGTG